MSVASFFRRVTGKSDPTFRGASLRIFPIHPLLIRR